MARNYGIPSSTEDLIVRKGGIVTFEDGQTVFTDGQGNKSWLTATASASANSVIFPSADASIGLRYTIKRKDTTLNELKVWALSGNVEGTATYSIVTQNYAFTFQSDGTNYFIISKYP